MSNPFADINAQRRKDIERTLKEVYGALDMLDALDDWPERAVGEFGSH